MDISMPDLNGIEATRQIIANNSAIKIIALSMHSENIYITGMMNAGASGYIAKSSSVKELIKGIKVVLKGEIFLCPKTMKSVADNDGHLALSTGASIFAILSNKEREVLQLIAEGYKSKLIAGRLEISTRTVEVHRANLTKKLNIHSIAGLTKFAIAEGITSINF